jgi:hypothetical protein
MNRAKQLTEQGAQTAEIVSDLDDGDGAVCEGCADLEEFDRDQEIDAGKCIEHISRARNRYQNGDPDCEADYRHAYLLDSRLAVSEIVRGLENEVRDDVAYVLINCMERLASDSRDVVARTRLGLALLLLYQDVEAYHNLQRAFLQSPDWRPLLRLLVNKVKLRRAKVYPRILPCP